jgi:DNA repair exonuclease SbcCD ATPase subunit
VSLKSQAEVKKAVVNERKLLAASLERSYKAAVEKRDLTKQSLSLEKDVVALVGRQGFLGSIVEEVLVEIAAAANDILSQVANVRHLSVDFETEKVAETTGNAKARITLCVFSRGRKVSFASGISGGMQIAVELAVDLAVGDVVGRRKGSWPGWIVFDESLEGLGSSDKESALEMLKTQCQNRLVIVIDHNSEFQGLFDEVIEVLMVDGRSKIV